MEEVDYSEGGKGMGNGVHFEAVIPKKRGGTVF